VQRRIAILGNFSGRNAGDAAILGNILEDFSPVLPDVEYAIPTLSPSFIRKNFGSYRVRPLDLRPWCGSLKIFGIPTLRAMLGSDLVLITDNILFDRRFFNPAFNYLSTISLFAPLCRRRGIPLVVYNGSLGPVETPIGVRALRKVLDACAAIILRDVASIRLLDDLGLRHPEPILAADSALNTRPPAPAVLDRLAARIGLVATPDRVLGFNVNAYVDRWRRGGGRLGTDRFLSIISSTLDRLVAALDVEVLFVVTQRMDSGITREAVARMASRGRVHIADDPRFTYREIAGLLSRVGVHVGMRTHSLIFAAAVGTPMVGINAYPKNAAFLETIGQRDRGLEIEDLDADRLFDLVVRTWRSRGEICDAMAREIPREQAKARESAKRIADLIGLGTGASVSATGTGW
jgi:polysaccharide pyruvyl transferase WcaK-like protein